MLDEKTDRKEKFLTMGLLAAAVASQMFLFAVSYTNASFTAQERPIRDYLAPSQIVSAHFDNQLTIIADNLRWSVAVSGQAVKGQALAFLGLSDNNLPNAYNSVSVASLTHAIQPQVLGAYQVNPEYSH